ncbi:cache domain-containing sensor histidine kinase [Eisenbergiella porci]|uniref:cache domain-containing sensor histidine kinase n=1 Tax=Eisenbergiella porci TaxID=2652274 RepID=UPI0022E76568|nr:sensor histidine kinase [Eisenbergiella porci]
MNIHNARLINLFMDLKLRYKLLLVYFVVISVILGISSRVIYSSSAEILESKINDTAKQSFSQTVSFLSYKIKRLISSSNTIRTDQKLLEALTHTLDSYTLQDQLEDYQKLRLLFETYEDENEGSRIRLYVDDRYLYAKENKNILGLAGVQNELWYQRLEESQDGYLLLPASIVEAEGGEGAVLVRFIRNPKNYRENLAVLRIDMDAVDLNATLSKAGPAGTSTTFLFNARKEMVASVNWDDAQEIPKEILMNIPAGEGAGQNFNEKLVMGQKVLLAEERINGTDWTMITMMPYSSFMGEISELKKKTWGITFFIIFAAAILIYVISSAITRRISRLERHMQISGEKPEMISEEINYNDEVGSLYHSYNEMVYKYQKSLEERYYMGQELKNAELLALQAQINPHFLYNTLDTINWLVYQNRGKEVSTIVKSLAKFYKMTLNKGKSIVTIRDEVVQVQNYMNIQNIRFSGKISVDFDLEEEIMEFAIPKITLQPIVENAILHGILEKDETEGKIFVKGSLEEKKICLKVVDDGNGMEEDKCKELLEGGYDSGGYGLKNIWHRLKILYGDEAVMEINSESGSGTLVMVRFPARYPTDLRLNIRNN